MVEIIKELNIEVSKPNVFQAVVAKQYDMNTRFIKATFVDFGQKITIPQSDTLEVRINAQRPDGEAKGFKGEINTDGTATVPLHSWMLEQVGTVTCDISVIDMAEGAQKQLTTTSFTLIVEKAAWGGDGMTNDPQYNLLIELLNTVDAAGEIAEEALQKSNEANAVYDSMVEVTRASEAIIENNETIISAMNGRLDEAIAMRGGDGSTVFEQKYDDPMVGDFELKIISSGANARIEISAVALVLASVRKEIAIDIPAAYAPMEEVRIEGYDGSTTMFLTPPAVSGGSPTLSYFTVNPIDNSGYVHTDMQPTVYPLASMYIPEIEDARVGYDGTVYESAGTAVREQIRNLKTNDAAKGQAISELREDVDEHYLIVTASGQRFEKLFALLGEYRLPQGFVPGKNLYDKDAATFGVCQVKYDDGTYRDSTDYQTSQPMPVEAGETYVLSVNGNKSSKYYCVVYDKDHNYIGGTNSVAVKGGMTLNPFTIPANGAYVVFSTAKASTNVQFEKGTEPTEYEAYKDPADHDQGEGYFHINAECLPASVFERLDSVDETLSDVDETLSDVVKKVSDPYAYESDIPENIGVLNAILNFKQLSEISIEPATTMPVFGQGGRDWYGNEQYTGLPYSSSRIEEGFVPNFVSLETFMTALQNPKSYLYTVNLEEDYENDNGKTYYGAVCSTSCAYALNIVPNYTTHQWKDIPGMEEIPWQSVYALKLGDTLCHKTSGHVVMVTDITRNRRGKIGHITISEAAKPSVRSKNYTPEALAEEYPVKTGNINNEWVYCRYSKINEVQHNQSPFVAVEDEDSKNAPYTYNTHIIPRKGDKANWLEGVPVEIDLFKKGNYDTVKVYKCDELGDELIEEILVGGVDGDEQSIDRTVHGLCWAMQATTGATTKNSALSTYIPLMDADVSVGEGVKVKVFYYDEAQNTVGDSGKVWLESGFSISDLNLPDTAKLIRVMVRLLSEADFSDMDAVTSKVNISVPAEADTLPIVLEGIGIVVDTGANATTGSKRCRSGFLPLQNLKIVPDDDVQYYLCYYDSDKAHINSHGWLTSETDLLELAPENAAYFRVMVSHNPEKTINTIPGTYALKIRLNIIEEAAGVNYIVLNDLEYGDYKACLTNGTERPYWCYWMVVDAKCDAVSGGVGSRQATVTFSASNAEPLFVKWSGGKDNGTKHINVLSKDEKAAGVATVNYVEAYEDGQDNSYKMRVAFKTKYGIIHTPLPEAITV